MSPARNRPVRISIRLRLTLWNTSVLALMLIGFAIAGMVTLREVLQDRGATTVRESARAIASAVITERHEVRARGDTVHIEREAARDVLREMRIGDLDVFIVDDAARVIAANRLTAFPSEGVRSGAPSATDGRASADTVVLAPPVRELLRLRPPAGDVIERSITIDDVEWHAALVRVDTGAVSESEPTLVVGVLRSEAQDTAVLTRVRTTLLLAIPFALLLTIAAGYALARRSLAPVDEMAATAARISAATLSERLPVVNSHDELGRLAQVINDLLRRVDDAFRTQKQFVADASHELRTPIAIVRGEADVTLQRTSREEHEYRESLAVIHDESVRLTRIVDDLFLLARADAASPLNRHERVDIAELIANGVRSVRTIADERGIVLDLIQPASPTVPAYVDGDPALLRRLLLNLLDNALKHTPVGGRVTVTIEAHGTDVGFVVSDTGAGIPDALRSDIFGRFVRTMSEPEVDLPVAGGASRIPTASGAGLGLAIAQSIANAHGGHIALEPSSSGATFRVVLPATGHTTRLASPLGTP